MYLSEVGEKIRNSVCKDTIVFISKENNQHSGGVTLYPGYKIDELKVDERIDELVGIYDRNVKQEWIEEDFLATLKHLNLDNGGINEDE